MFAGVLKQKFR